MRYTHYTSNQPPQHKGFNLATQNKRKNQSNESKKKKTYVHTKMKKIWDWGSKEWSFMLPHDRIGGDRGPWSVGWRRRRKGNKKKNTEFGRVSEPQVWLFAGGCTKRRAAHLNNINVGSWTVMIWLRLKVGWCGGDQRFVNLRISVMEPVTLWVIHDEVECNEAESPRFIIYFYL